MKDTSYSTASRILHRIALGAPFVAQTGFDIEKSLCKVRVDLEVRHVFVAGLARSGTTILLRALHGTGAFRSLTYRDMPFVLMPNAWKKFSRAFHKEEPAKERAHGDRILVDFDSPEAFEEVFWRTFCGSDYIRPDHLCPHAVDNETLQDFAGYVARVVASGKESETRYLSKNNNNILRLPSIHQIYPRACILIPFRDPIQHAYSLLKQHENFCRIHRDDPFARSYMRWLAHHEFGLTHKPFRFDSAAPPGDEHANPFTINYWLNLWVNTYEFILRTKPENALLIAYEALCDQPRETMAKISAYADLGDVDETLYGQFQAAPPAQVEGVDAFLETRAREIYQSMTK